jgi:hypothetical protein
MASALKEVNALGQTLGNADNALLDACKVFSTLANTTVLDVSLDVACKKFGDEFADGRAKTNPRGDITAGSRKLYQDQMVLWSDKRVFPHIDSIVKTADEFCKTVDYKARGERNFITLAKAAASALKKEKVSEITRELFVGICSKEKPAPKPEKILALAKESFVESCLTMQRQGFLAGENLAAMMALANKLGLSIMLPVVTPTPAPAPAPAPEPEPKADLAAVIAAAVAAAMAGMAK